MMDQCKHFFSQYGKSKWKYFCMKCGVLGYRHTVFNNPSITIHPYKCQKRGCKNSAHVVWKGKRFCTQHCGRAVVRKGQGPWIVL